MIPPLSCCKHTKLIFLIEKTKGFYQFLLKELLQVFEKFNANSKS